MEDAHELKVVSIRLVDEPPLLSKKAIKNPRDVIEVMGEHLQKYDRELFCILNLQTKGQVINMNIVSMGTLNIALVHPVRYLSRLSCPMLLVLYFCIIILPENVPQVNLILKLQNNWLNAVT